jgi:hypothetical protein
MSNRNPIPLPVLTASEGLRFWSKVDKTPGQGPHGECWEWRGGKIPSGYGQMWLYRQNGRKAFSASRLMYKLATGEDPCPLLVLHTCDNPPCCNPEHLFLGTNQDNIDDMVAKGRHSFATNNPMHNRVSVDKRTGENSSSAILTEVQVSHIRELLSAGNTQLSIANAFGVSRFCIGSIHLRKTWKHMP